MSTKNSNPTQASKLSRAEKIKLLERGLSPILSTTEHAVFSFIFDRTVRFNKTTETIPVRHFVGGFVSNRGKIIHGGTGLSDSTVRRAINSLKRRGLISQRKSRKWSGNSNEFEINWTGVVMAVQAHEASLRTLELDKKTTSQSDEGCLSGGIDYPVKMTAYNNEEKQRKNNNGKERALPAFCERSSFETIASEGGKTGKTALKYNQEQHSARTKVTSIDAIWRSAVLKNWEGTVVAKFTRKQHGQAKHLFDLIGSETITFVEWSVANWHLVRCAKFPGNRVKFPNTPDFGFLLAFRQSFLDVFNERTFHERIAGHPNAGLIVTLRKQGHTIEQAIDIVEEQDRKKKRKDKLDAREVDLQRREDALDRHNRKGPLHPEKMNARAPNTRTRAQKLDDLTQRRRPRGEGIKVLEITPWE